MSLPDPHAAAFLGADVIRPIFFVYMDLDGDQVRANSSGYDITPSGTGDPDLDGHIFYGVTHEFLEVSPVRVGQGGSDTVMARLSGLPSLDADTLNLIGDPRKWQGRVARIWRVIRDASNIQRGGFQSFYTGYMTAADIAGDGQEQSITVAIETYLAAFSNAPMTNYLSQEKYDPGDLSARAAVAIANGVSEGAKGVTPLGALAYLITNKFRDRI